MSKPREIDIKGIPDGVESDLVAVLTSRLYDAVNKFLSRTGQEEIYLQISTLQQNSKPDTLANKDFSPADYLKRDSELAYESRIKKYKPQKPLFSFDQLVVSETVLENLLIAIEFIHVKSKVFDEWGLRKIEPFPRAVLNFYGKPGTGKTLAAHAIATKIERNILAISYAQLESMYHGEGPKNVDAVFLAAERENAVLFIDEAESLLSKRLTNVTQGSEEAINSMRSQLLIRLEQFRGVAIFSTNLVESYDKAFETRVRNVYFPMPDEDCRRELWRKHLSVGIPLAANVSFDKLAQIDDVCGRDIKNAVIDAAIRVARRNDVAVELGDLISSVERIKAEKTTDK